MSTISLQDWVDVPRVPQSSIRQLSIYIREYSTQNTLNHSKHNLYNCISFKSQENNYVQRFFKRELQCGEIGGEIGCNARHAYSWGYIICNPSEIYCKDCKFHLYISKRCCTLLTILNWISNSLGFILFACNCKIVIIIM